MTDKVVHIKTLRQKDMVLFTVSAILLLDTLAAAALVDASSVFWWVFLGVFFFLPFALICAEMGCSYPAQGGIYAWIRDAFGGRWASRVTWGYWVNTAIWMPAIYILFAGVFKQMFFPERSLGWQIMIAVGLTWIAVLVNIITLDADHPRPYKITGGLLVARACAWICILVLALAIALFMYTPGEGFQLPVVAGVIFMLVVGELVIRFAENHRIHL